MRRRLQSLLLTAIVALTGVALGACPVGRCAAMQADATATPPDGGQAAQGGRGGHTCHAGPGTAAQAHDGTEHAMHRPAAHDCCTRDGIASPRCCPDSVRIAERSAPPSIERTSQSFALAAARPVPAGIAALPTAAADPPRRVTPGAPPGTLIAQHTSLLV